jgi:hypothetical protein
VPVLSGGRQLRAELAAPIYFTPVPDLDDHDYKHIVCYFVDDPINPLNVKTP